MKFLIVSLNSKYIHSSLAPWCLVSGTREYVSLENSKVQVLEGTINENMEDVKNRVIDESPDVIAFSCYIWNIKKVYELVSLIKEEFINKEHQNPILILGGPEVSYCTREVLTCHPEITAVISGEGELPFAKLTKALELGEDIENIPGVATQKCKETEAYIYCENSFPPSPYIPEFFENLNERIVYLETSRGCPYSCAFCLSGRCGGVKFYPIERAKKEILLLAKCGTKTVKFVDRTFNANKKRANELWRFIIEKRCSGEIPEGVCFHFEIAGDLLDDSAFEIIETAPMGLLQFEIGMQSFNERTLESINRTTDVDRLVSNIRCLLEIKNCHVHIDLIAGLPLEDYDSFKNSFNIGYSLHADMLQLGFLKLLHGADMRELPEKYPCEYCVDPPYEVLETPWISKEEFSKLHRLEDVVDRVVNSGRFRRTLELLSPSNPFDFFMEFALSIPEDVSGISLDEYTEMFWNFIREKGDEKLIRDAMVKDRLLSNASGKLPECLKVFDEALRKAKIFLESNPETKSKKGVKRAVAILYTESKIMYVDYLDRNPVTLEYSAKYVSFGDGSW